MPDFGGVVIRFSLRFRVRGFTLIELLVTIAVMVLIIAMAAPFTIDWMNQSRTQQAYATLLQGFNQAKALALRNPCGAPNIVGTHASSLQAKIDGPSIVVSVLAQENSDCSYLASSARPNPQWSAHFPPGVVLILGGVTLTEGAVFEIKLDNRGIPFSDTSFIVRQGGIQNDETGNLY